MALRFLINFSNKPVEKIATSLLFRHSAGAKTSAPGVTLPQKPKMPRSGYIRFVAETMAKLKTEAPGTKSSDMVVKASKLWRELDPAERKRFNDASATERAKWHEKVAAFEAQLSQRERDQLVAERQRQRDRQRDERQRRQRRRQLTDLQRPRKPPNSFMLFYMERVPERKDMHQKEFLAEIGKRWAGMSEEDKFPYVKRFQDLKETYAKELEAWEKRMIKEGRSDLVGPVLAEEEVTKGRHR
ncbi:transcription factor A, mitochondrial-like [Pollicipes pollicipes]|uniref:transcription factor A, mitochondrial-like n=1 Tax=Pollicipes pollicipes TaxID=41117 RepID=UPI0018850C17|nr:transcription factor A, mitochondrial-like [Pollicipes pollicipes]